MLHNIGSIKTVHNEQIEKSRQVQIAFLRNDKFHRADLHAADITAIDKERPVADNEYWDGVTPLEYKLTIRRTL